MVTWLLAAYPEWLTGDVALIDFPMSTPGPTLGDRVVLVHAAKPRRCLEYGEFTELIPRWPGSDRVEGWVELGNGHKRRPLRVGDITKRTLLPSVPGTLWRLTKTEAAKAATYFRRQPPTQARDVATAPTDPASAAGPRRRRAESIQEERSAFTYTVATLERSANPAHKNYQARLGRFLRQHGIMPVWEQDFVDLRFRLGNQSYIGEIKVTGGIQRDEAFRAALGQLLDYADAEEVAPAGTLMLLDFPLNGRRLALVTRLGISVAWERAQGDYELLNPSLNVRLGQAWKQPRGGRRSGDR